MEWGAARDEFLARRERQVSCPYCVDRLRLHRSPRCSSLAECGYLRAFFDAVAFAAAASWKIIFLPSKVIFTLALFSIAPMA